MNFSIFKIFQIFGIVSTWATKAFADGVVTLAEAVELAIALCAILGIPTQLDLPDPNPTVEVVPDTSLDLQELPGEEKDLTDSERPPPDEESPKLKSLNQ